MVIHVGTNDLAKDDAVTVSKRLEGFIQDAQQFINTIAISGVIQREDGRVPEGRISLYNDLTKELCRKLNVHYIDNNNIHGSYLNGSKLHLNRTGDKALGKNFCSYLRSIRQCTNTHHPYGSKQNFFFKRRTNS